MVIAVGALKLVLVVNIRVCRRRQGGSHEGESCLLDELAEKRCFAQILCPDAAMKFYGTFG